MIFNFAAIRNKYDTLRRDIEEQSGYKAVTTGEPRCERDSERDCRTVQTLERWRDEAQSRPVRGRTWAAGARLEAVITAAGLMHHSDRSSRYVSHTFQRELGKYGIICSMSRKGNCWDNAPTES
jgi:transposase InsO family protein